MKFFIANFFELFIVCIHKLI